MRQDMFGGWHVDDPEDDIGTILDHARDYLDETDHLYAEIGVDDAGEGYFFNVQRSYDGSTVVASDAIFETALAVHDYLLDYFTPIDIQWNLP